MERGKGKGSRIMAYLKPDITELQDFREREWCNYIFQRGRNVNQQSPQEIPLGNHFCRTHAKIAFPKKLL